MARDPADRLDAVLDTLRPGVLVAFSGGVDSSLLVVAAARALGREAVLAATADSPSLPAHDRADALLIARRFDVPHVWIQTGEFGDPRYLRNDSERCFFCKTHLFETLRRRAVEWGFEHLAFGAILDDLADDRPGHRAAERLRVRAPLLEAGLTKEEVRELARRFGLPVWNKPSSACLASRIRRGLRVDPRVLARVDLAERRLRFLGFRQVRVRHEGTRARVEVEPESVGRFSDETLRARVEQMLLALGWQEVEIDPRGYRSPGSEGTSRFSSSQTSNARAGM